jgi:hypothetical protein
LISFNLELKEVGKQIKDYTELNGRTDSNLIDTLNALLDYSVTSDNLKKHLDSKTLSISNFK